MEDRQLLAAVRGLGGDVRLAEPRLHAIQSQRDAVEQRNRGLLCRRLLLLWLLPWFGFGYFLLLCSYVAPLTTYIILRNKSVGEADRVLTPAHLRFWFSEQAAKIGVKVAAEKVDPHSLGPDVKILTQQGSADPAGAGKLVQSPANARFSRLRG